MLNLSNLDISVYITWFTNVILSYYWHEKLTMYSTDTQLPDGLIGVLKDLWPFLSYDGLGLDSDPTSSEALQALANYQHICDDDIRADFTQTSHIEQCLDDVPELSDSESISESGML